MSHLLLRVQQSDCLSAEERGLRGGIPSLCEKESRWEQRRRWRRMERDDSWRGESAASSESVKQDSCFCCWPPELAEGPKPPRTKGPLFLFPPAVTLFSLPLSFFLFFSLLLFHSQLIAIMLGQDLTSQTNKVLQVCRKGQWQGFLCARMHGSAVAHPLLG